MALYNSLPRNSSGANRPSNPGRRHRADFARAAVFGEFGRHARALDQANFVDRQPGTLPRPSPEAWVR